MSAVNLTGRLRAVLLTWIGGAALATATAGGAAAQGGEAATEVFLAEIGSCYEAPTDHLAEGDRIELLTRFESDGYVYERPDLVTSRLETPGQRALLRAAVEALQTCGVWDALENPAARTEVHLAADASGFEVISIAAVDPEATDAAAAPAPDAAQVSTEAAEAESPAAPDTAEAATTAPEGDVEAEVVAEPEPTETAGAAAEAEAPEPEADAGMTAGTEPAAASDPLPGAAASDAGDFALGSTETYTPKVVAVPAGEAEETWRVLSAYAGTESDEAALGLTREARRDIQRRLTLLDHDTRGVDGVFGQGTRDAIAGWQSAEALPQTGYLSGPQVELLKILSQDKLAAWEREQPSRTATRTSKRSRTYRGSDGCLRTRADNKRSSIIVGKSVYCDLRKIGLR